jgi:hypothetical protein
MRHTGLIVLAAIGGLALVWNPGSLRAQVPPDMQIRLGIYAQVHVEASSLGTTQDGRVFMELQRVRPRFELTLNDWVEAVVEPDFGQNRARLRNAFIAFEVTEAATIRVGQFKKPFGLIQRTSSSLVPVIQRGVRIAGLADRVETRGEPETLPGGAVLIADEQTMLDTFGYQGYAVGAAVAVRAGRLEFETGVFEGPTGSAEQGGRRGGAAARVGLLVAPGVRLGSALSHSRLAFGEELRDGTAGSVELAAGDPGQAGPGLLAEGVFGRGVGTGTDFAGGQVIAWLHRTMSGRFVGVEPLVRASYGDPDVDEDDDGGLLFSAGVNLYMGGRNRLMLDWDVYSAQDERIGTEGALRAQAQVRF